MATLTVHIDDQLKKQVQKQAKKEGLTLTALITQFFKSFAKQECGLTLKLKDEIIEAMHEADEAIKNGTAKLYDNVDEMFEEILNEPDESDEIQHTSNQTV